jgi:hypothetical protein
VHGHAPGSGACHCREQRVITALQAFVVADIVGGVTAAIAYAVYTLPGGAAALTAGAAFPWYLYHLEGIPSLAEAAGVVSVLGAILLQRSLAVEEHRALSQRLQLARIVAAAERAHNESRHRFLR